MRSKQAVIVIVIVLLVSGGGWWAWRNYSPTKIGAIQATGTIEGTEVNLSAQNAGIVQNLTVDEGDAVKQGQVVAAISRNDLVAQRDQAAEAVAAAQANLDGLVSGARTQQISAAQASVQANQASYTQALDDLARNQQLYQSGAISQSLLEQYQTVAEVDKNQLASAQAALSLLQAGSTSEAIAAAQAQVKQSQALLQSAQAVLGYLSVVSPINGVVITKNYEQGEFVTAGAHIVTVEDLNDLWIMVYIPTDQLPSIKLGQRVHFTVSGLTNDFTGTVEEINSQGQFTLKTIQTKEELANVVFGVKIRIGDQSGVLKPGMPADATFD